MAQVSFHEFCTQRIFNLTGKWFCVCVRDAIVGLLRQKASCLDLLSYINLDILCVFAIVNA